MKCLSNFFATAILAIALAGCADEAAQDNPVHFNFKIADNHVVTDLPSGTMLLVSMETVNGDPIYDLQEISFSKDVRGFSTSALDLKPGEYIVTEFMLVSPDRRILYATPPLSGSVSNPLGLNFQVSANDRSDVQTEVLNVDRLKPADLGLASFNIRNSFQVEVSQEGDMNISAKAMILKDQDTVAFLNLPANKGRIAFDGDPDEMYTLVVSQSGSAPYIQQGSMNELVAQYGKKPLKVSLKHAFTMVANASTEPVSFYIGGTQGGITVNWGDGTTESYSLDTEYEFEVAHSYELPTDYPITITGDLENIHYFYSFYGGSVFREISFKNLINLIEIRYGLTNCPSVIDLSHNSKLQFAMLPGLEDMETLILPRSHEISFIEIDGTNKLNTQDIDQFVDNMYRNTIKNGITNGLIGMSNSWAQEEGDLTMVGPPSAEAMAKLLYLQTNYGWYIRPSEAVIETLADNRFYGKKHKKI